MKYELECLKYVLQMDMLKTEFNNHFVQTLEKTRAKTSSHLSHVIRRTTFIFNHHQEQQQQNLHFISHSFFIFPRTFSTFRCCFLLKHGLNAATEPIHIFRTMNPVLLTTLCKMSFFHLQFQMKPQHSNCFYFIFWQGADRQPHAETSENSKILFSNIFVIECH